MVFAFFVLTCDFLELYDGMLFGYRWVLENNITHSRVWSNEECGFPVDMKCGKLLIITVDIEPPLVKRLWGVHWLSKLQDCSIFLVSTLSQESGWLEIRLFLDEVFCYLFFIQPKSVFPLLLILSIKLLDVSVEIGLIVHKIKWILNAPLTM